MRLLMIQLLYFPACEGLSPAVSRFNSLPWVSWTENISNDLSELMYTSEVLEPGLKSAGTRSTACAAPNPTRIIAPQLSVRQPRRAALTCARWYVYSTELILGNKVDVRCKE